MEKTDVARWDQDMNWRLISGTRERPPSPDRSQTRARPRVRSRPIGSRRPITSVIVCGVACLGLLGVAPARAHVTLEVQQAPAHSTYKAVFRVLHGCGGAATTRITVQVPPGVTHASPMPKPGWRLTTTPRGNDTTPAGHDAVPEVASVTWEGGRLESAHYDEFVIRIRLPDRPGELLHIPIIQECEGGRSVSWTQIPDPNRRPTDYPTPAASLRLTPRS